jgi:hypothetical protein
MELGMGETDIVGRLMHRARALWSFRKLDDREARGGRRRWIPYRAINRFLRKPMNDRKIQKISTRTLDHHLIPDHDCVMARTHRL